MFNQLTLEQCQQARLSRDARFDGQFFIAVKTTGIFCRPVCPATPPKEENVSYFAHAALASEAGYRPCLRCRPDSAPGSWAWRGTETTFVRAIKFIEQGALQTQTLAELAERLGITDRYLRQLFQEHLSMSPKHYAQFHQLMFAKQLLHSSALSIAEVAFASGFNSVRRFNDAFKKILKLKPSDIRKNDSKKPCNEIYLAYRPPLNWQHMLNFLQLRLVQGVEKIEDQSYQRTFEINGALGWFKISPQANHTLCLKFSIDDALLLQPLVNQVRRMFDLDADLHTIEQHLAKTPIAPLITSGIRIPGVWSPWEAGVRAILGQQVSVKAAITHLNHFVNQLGTAHTINDESLRFFPTPAKVAHADLSFLKMPQSRKDTLSRFANFVATHPDASPTEWLTLKGIGPWTIQYAQLRGLSEPDHFLSTDLVIKKARQQLPEFDPKDLSPWGSYATFHCWNSQS